MVTPSMRLFRDAPIERKLTLMTLLTSGVALLLACIAFLTYEIVVFRGTMVSELSTTAAIVGDNSAAALSFNDPASAEQTLQSLDAHPHVVTAAIYGANGKLFAWYRRTSFQGPGHPPAVGPDGHRFEGGYLKLFHRIDLAGNAAGTVFIQSDLEEMHARLYRYGLIVSLVLAVATLAAFVLSRPLQAAIAGPIAQLAGIVGVIAQDKNFSVRAVKRRDDELGKLIDGFNEMLVQIQSRDTALQAARDGLEQRVEARTRELQREVAERAKAEQALRVQEERTRLIIDKAFDAIVSADIDGRVIEWNAQAEAVFGWSTAEAVGRNLAELIIPPQHREAHRAGLRRFMAMGAGPILNRRIEVTGLRKDGQEIPCELAVTPIRVGDGYLFNAFLRDITERKKAEADLNAAHQRLLDISRQAGMAEVATGVLHNVGNVLNSVNVSANLVAEYVQKSKGTDLTRVVKLLREHAHDLATFLASDARGKHLPRYLADLAEHLQAERDGAAQELRALLANVEHIRDIVSMQQSYAKVAGVQEQIKVADLVEDALRLNVAALSRHGVEIVRQFEDAPVINLDKHKALQILVNLIRNAKYACEEAARTDKRLTLRVTTTEDRVQIAVSDNGIGIAAENLTRIFNHGFTTRKTGHGFGLHSGALAARELGGSLSVHSDGVGRGATFTLELPVQGRQVGTASQVAYG